MTTPTNQRTIRWKAVWGPKRTFAALALILLGLSPTVMAANRGNAKPQHYRQAPTAKPGQPSSRVKGYKLDPDVARRGKGNPLSTSRVIVTLVPGAQLPAEFKRFVRGNNLDIVNGVVLELPNGVIKQLESRSEIFQVHDDRPIAAHNYRTSVTVGATAVRDLLGYKGDGIGVAIIDSGIST